MSIWGLATVGMASGAGIATGALTTYMRNNYGSLRDSAKVDCVPDADGNCSLIGSYGIGLEAVNFVSMAFNFLLMVLMIRKWAKYLSGSARIPTAMLRTAFTMLLLASIVALAFNGFVAFTTIQFGSQVQSGNLGTECSATASCSTLGGTTGNTMYGLGISTIILSGASLILYASSIATADRVVW